MVEKEGAAGGAIEPEPLLDDEGRPGRKGQIEHSTGQREDEEEGQASPDGPQPPTPNHAIEPSETAQQPEDKEHGQIETRHHQAEDASLTACTPASAGSLAGS